MAAEDRGIMAPRRRARTLWLGAGAAALAVVIAVAVALMWPRPTDVRVVAVSGAEYTTNIEVREEAGYVYAYLPVNADADDVVLEADDPEDTRTIRAFLDGLDTFVPGEHIIDLRDAHLHVIVDGIPEEE